MSSIIVGVRFSRVGKLYHFDASALPDVKPGDQVAVETSRGRQLGEVVKLVDPASHSGGPFKKVSRMATSRDLVMLQMWKSKELAATIECRARAAELGLKGVKIVRALYNYDGSRLTCLYSAKGREKLNMRPLLADMRKRYPRTAVELRQIGPRDAAKLLGGMGACGLETRCCSMFLTEFSPVSIKMAKAQGVSLSPDEITGSCGRLRCCLVYEYEQYVKASKGLPRRGKKVLTPRGQGKVVDVLPLRGTAVVYLGPEVGRVEFTREELQPRAELEALREKARKPCARHEGGGCTCGRASRKN